MLNLMGDAPVWGLDGRDWPNREFSRFVQAGGLRWHVQQMGQGPVIVLVHGTGAATHSWRDLAPLLAQRFTVVAPDLPGHGFTEQPPSHRLSLPGMATALTALLRELEVRPEIAVGHSAGAAILARMALDGDIAPHTLVGLNAALLPFRGVPSQVFAPAARLLASFPLVPELFAWHAAGRGVIERLLDGTGSRLDPAGIALYRRLAASPGHVAAALGMMANWDLAPLVRDLPRLQPLLVLVVGSRDRTIPPEDAFRVRELVPTAVVMSLPGLGHLAHEERPGEIAEILDRLAVSTGELPC